MNSKEALNELRKLNPQTTIQNTLLIERYLDICKGIVEKDLEKLDILEEENKKLKDEINHEKDMRFGENQYAKTIIDDLKINIEKLQNIINILKYYLMIKVFINNEGEYILDANDYSIPNLTKEQYELFKEVLEND